jgi:hypothetical protein
MPFISLVGLAAATAVSAHKTHKFSKKRLALAFAIAGNLRCHRPLAEKLTLAEQGVDKNLRRRPAINPVRGVRGVDGRRRLPTAVGQKWNSGNATDPSDAFETLEHAARRLLAAGFTRASRRMRVYVLVGFPKNTFAGAEARLRQMQGIGFTPMAMLWRPETPSQEKYAPDDRWRGFQRQWARPAIIHARAA